MSYKTIVYERKGKILYITLNRPDRLNALNRQMFDEMAQAWDQFNRDDEAWVAIVTGAGKAMCVGVDVKAVREGEFVMPKNSWEDVGEDRAGPLPREVAKPTIAAINGYCCGAGLDFATECDIVICSEDAQFWDPHVAVGLISNHEQVQMARRVSVGVALQMGIMGSRYRMNAQRALQVGLVSEVVRPDALLPRATEIADSILEQSRLAVIGTKRCILNIMELPLDDAVRIGEYIRREVIGTEDYIEGPRAFAERRKPNWVGR